MHHTNTNTNTDTDTDTDTDTEMQRIIIDSRALKSLNLKNINDLDHLFTDECFLVNTYPADYPIDKFRINDDSRINVVCWLIMKLIFGKDFVPFGKEFIKSFWKCCKSKCSNSTSGLNRHVLRLDKKVCVNPYHYEVESHKNISFDISVKLQYMKYNKSHVTHFIEYMKFINRDTNNEEDMYSIKRFDYFEYSDYEISAILILFKLMNQQSV